MPPVRQVPAFPVPSAGAGVERGKEAVVVGGGGPREAGAGAEPEGSAAATTAAGAGEGLFRAAEEAVATEGLVEREGPTAVGRTGCWLGPVSTVPPLGMKKSRTDVETGRPVAETWETSKASAADAPDGAGPDRVTAVAVGVSRSSRSLRCRLGRGSRGSPG